MIYRILKLVPTITVFSLFLIEPVFGVEAIGTGLTSETQKLLGNLQNLLGLFLSMLNILMWPLLSMIGSLMSNDMIFGPQVEDRLYLIWGQMRNLINLSFVLILVGLAIYNVLGLGEENNYTLKKILPKFIIALLAINFTFFGAKVILSSVNVLTTAIYALPNSIDVQFANTNEMARSSCKAIQAAYPQNSLCLNENTFTPQAESYFQRFSGDNIAYIMAINYGQISNLLEVSALVQASPTLQNITINIIISIIMYFVYIIAFIVLFLVLLARVVVLWFTIALSPLLAVQIIFPEQGKSLMGDIDIKDIFLKHAFAPAIIGLGLVVGHLLLDAYKATTAPSLGSSLGLGQDFANAFSSTAGSEGLQGLVIGLAAAGVVWKITFTAADKTVVKGVTDSMKGFIERNAKIVAKMPTYTPIIPVPNSIGKKASLASIPSTIENKLDQVRRAGTTPMGGDNDLNKASELNRHIRSSSNKSTFHLDRAALTVDDTRLNKDLNKDRVVKMLENLVANNGVSSEKKNDLTKLINAIKGNNTVSNLYDIKQNTSLNSQFESIFGPSVSLSSVSIDNTPAAPPPTTTTQ